MLRFAFDMWVYDPIRSQLPLTHERYIPVSPMDPISYSLLVVCGHQSPYNGIELMNAISTKDPLLSFPLHVCNLEHTCVHHKQHIAGGVKLGEYQMQFLFESVKEHAARHVF